MFNKTKLAGCILFLILLQQSILITRAIFEDVGPQGSTGCSPKHEGGICWRYCKGNSGDWCYTSLGCQNQESICTNQTDCGGASCKLTTEPGCVEGCPPSLKSDPEGATGCDVKKQGGGWCWRYCRGNTGKWCFTKQESKCRDGFESTCAYREECDPRRSCEGEGPDCVYYCPYQAPCPAGPQGATGCHVQEDGDSYCWRYCREFNGKWCPTSRNCTKNHYQCARNAQCDPDIPCESNEKNCVPTCIM